MAKHLRRFSRKFLPFIITGLTFLAAITVASFSLLHPQSVDAQQLSAGSGVTAPLVSFGATTWNAPTSYRGFMIDPLTFADPNSCNTAVEDPNSCNGALKELRAWNVNVVRWQMNVVGGRPLIDQVQEFAAQISSVTPYFRNAGIGIILDLHPPGSAGEAVHSALEQLSAARTQFVETWKFLANQFKNDTAIIGYDILNEPNMRVATWNTLANQTIQGIRTIDAFKPVILESVNGNPDRLRNLPTFAARDRVVYSFHMYHPLTYTHQGVIDPDGNGPKPLLPSRNLTSQVRKEAIEKLEGVRRWQREKQIRLYVGEFSVNRNAPGATDYLNLCLRKFEQYGWDWTYHAYRESPIWRLTEGDPSGLITVQQRLMANTLGPTFTIDATVTGTNISAMNSWTFYPQYYLAQYPDLRQAFGKNLDLAIQHWFASGVHEGRRPNPYFSAVPYLSRYADLRAAFGASNYTRAAEHWLAYGIKEGRNGI